MQQQFQEYIYQQSVKQIYDLLWVQTVCKWGTHLPDKEHIQILCMKHYNFPSVSCQFNSRH